MLQWYRYGFHKKCGGTHYSTLVVLHLVGSTGHVVHSGAFGAVEVVLQHFNRHRYKSRPLWFFVEEGLSRSR
jgi:hypothetical protein